MTSARDTAAQLPVGQGSSGSNEGDSRKVFSAPGGRTMVSLATQVGSAILNFASAVVLARWLGPAGKGSFSLVLTAGLIAAIVFGFGMNPGLSAWSARRLISPRAGLVVSVASTLVASVLTILIVGIEPTQLAAVGPTKLAPIVCAVAVFGQLQMAVAQGRGRMGAIAANGLLSLGLQVALYIGFASRVQGPRAISAALWCYIVAQGVGDVVGWLLITWKSDESWRVASNLGGLMAFGIAAAPVQILNVMNFRLDILILGGLAGVRETGLYSMAATGAQALMMVPTAVGLALSTDFGRCAPDVAGELAGRGIRLAAQATVAVAVLGCALAPALVELLLGPQYSATIAMFWVMVPGMVLFSLCGVTVSYYWNARVIAWVPNTIVAIALTVDIMLLLLVGKRYGGLGAAWASSVAYACAGVVNIVLFSRLSDQSLAVLLMPRRSDYRFISRLTGGHR